MTISSHTPPHGIFQVLYPDVWKPVSWLYFAVLGLAYVVVSVHIPITVLPDHAHDDGHYIKIGRYLTEGQWLGPYDQFTLIKGPGYPAFLAVAHALGISSSLAQALMHCFAITFFTAVCHRFIRSGVLSALMFALLLWQPIPLTTYLLRILRDEIYYAQTLFIVGLIALALFVIREIRWRLFWAALTGLVLGWFWLTREEGTWIIPGIALLVLGASLRARFDGQIRELVAMSMIAFSAFVGTQVGFRTLNWWSYGTFVGVEVKETNYLASLRALASVRSGGIKPFVPVSRAARQHIYNVSPAFASLKSYFDPANESPPGPDWVGWTCTLVPDTSCGEIAAGWFLWALRDATSREGHHASPSRASSFYGQIASEISAACARGDLECKPQLIAEMPPVTWGEVLTRLPSLYAKAFYMIILPSLPLPFNKSAGSDGDLAAALRFLNFPRYTPPSGAQDLVRYTTNGWYHRSGSEWMSLSVKASNGAAVPVRVERKASPDLQSGLKDPAAANQRFTFHTACNKGCVLTIETEAGEKLEKPFTEIQKGLVGFKIGSGDIVIESTMAVPNPAYVDTRLDRLSNRVRIAVLTNYHLVFLPVLALGAIMFVGATLLYWSNAAYNVCYVLALTTWTLMFMRASILILIEATSFPGLHPFYLAPAYFLAVAGAILSIAAWIQLSALHQTEQHTVPQSGRG